VFQDPLEQFSSSLALYSPSLVIAFILFVAYISYLLLSWLTAVESDFEEGGEIFLDRSISSRVYTDFQSELFELIELFILKICSNIRHGAYLDFMGWFKMLFLSILIINLSGMIPAASPMTSLLSVTMQLSISFFVGMNLKGVALHGLRILVIFLPKGTPFLIAPFLFLIEVLSYFTRMVSLSVRLFANLMAGHTLMHILIDFASLLLKKVNNFILLPIIMTLLFLIFILETVLGMMQAYVFALLTVLYLSDLLTLGH
jgi:F-type H+-transporting ATPase subunit a